MTSALIDPIVVPTTNSLQIDRNNEFDRMVQEVEKKQPSSHCIQFENYLLNESGFYYVPTDQSPIWICSPFWPEAYLRDANGKNHALLLKIKDDGIEHLWPMSRQIIGEWRELNKALLDIGMITPTFSKNQKYLQDFLMKVRPEKKLRCVMNAGWHGDQYVFLDGLVIGQSSTNESVYPVNKICPRGVKQKGSLSEWQDNVVNLCLGNSRLIFSLGIAFSSMCLGLINEEGCGFNFKGRSSIGKTKCLKVATSVFGSSDYKRSWKMTLNGLESICALYKDSLLPLDEFGQADAKDVGEIAYTIAQGMGKQRSDQCADAREPKTWTIMVMSTGEVGLIEHMREGRKQPRAGQMARFIDIPAELKQGYGSFESIHYCKDGEEFANEIDRMCSQYYGTAARAFIQSMVDYGIEKTKKDLRFAMEDFAADQSRNCDGQIKRVAKHFGIAYAALSHAFRLGILGSKITLDMIHQSCKNCFLDWLNDRGTKGDMESHQLIDQVKGLLNENVEGKFAAFNETSSDKRVRSLLWGYKKGTQYFIFPKAFKESICAGFDFRVAAKILIEHGLLHPSNDGRTSSRSERIPAHSKSPDRFYVIDLDQGQENVDNQ